MDGRQTTEMRVRESERRFLRHWGWVFPAAGLLLACLTGGGFWAWVDGQTPWLDWRQLFTWRAAVLGGAGAAFWGMWRGLSNVRCRGWIAVALAALGFAAAECAVRIPAAQTAFWLATRARSYFPDACYVRLEEVAGRQDDRPGIVLAGSSQMVFGVDEHLLGKMLAPKPVLRREIAGMWSQSMLAMWGYFPFRRGDVCVQVRSEFDFLKKPEFDVDWYRPMASLSGLPAVFHTAGWRLLAKNWRKVPDYTLATALECWRMRDGMGKLVLHCWRGEKKKGDASSTVWPERELTWLDWQWRAFEKAADMLKDDGVEFWVFEGGVNPLMYTQGVRDKHEEFLRRMAEGAAEGKWRFVTLEEQDAGIEPDDWADMTHLNAVGREKLTRAMGRVLAGAGTTQP
jgi:hypothetical protein